MAEEENPKKDKITPEERLFKVIATGGRDVRQISEDDEVPADFDDDPFHRLENLYRRLKDFIANRVVAPLRRRIPVGAGAAAAPHLPSYGFKPVRLGNIFRIKTVNKGLTVLVGILAFYLVFDFLFLRHDYKKMVNDLNVPLPQHPVTGSVPAPPDLSHYLTPAETRNIFLPPAVKLRPEQVAVNDAAVTAPPINLKLVGISWDNEEYVAMIEVEGEKAARFARKGSTVLNDVKIEDIREFSVTLSQGTRKWELT